MRGNQEKVVVEQLGSHEDAGFVVTRWIDRRTGRMPQQCILLAVECRKASLWLLAQGHARYPSLGRPVIPRGRSRYSTFAGM